MRPGLAVGVNVDPVNVAAGLELAARFGYDSAGHQMVIGYALRRHGRGEEDGAQASALSGGIDLTSWYAILAAALAAGQAESAAARARDLIAANASRLATLAAVAAAADVSRQAVSGWLRRWPDLSAEALVADWGRVKLLWWPSARRWMAGHGISFDASAGDPGGPGDEAVRDLIRANVRHLITPAGIARRAKVTPEAVSNWFRRWPDLDEAALVVDLGSVKLLWWPSVRSWLAVHHVPFTEE